MAFTRFKDDPDRVNKYLEESTFSGIYHLNTPGNGLNNPYIDDIHVRLQKWGANLQTNSLNVENELINNNRPLNRDTRVFGQVNTQMYHFSTNTFNIDESRASLPAWTLRDQSNKGVMLPLKPTTKMAIPFENNQQTRTLEKDYYTSKYY
jgi:hypothetical protein